jgi:hypothetical protein
MTKVTIGRLDLDLRGVPAVTAEAAARRLGPALGRALAERRLDVTSAARLDAGRIQLDAAPDAVSLATDVAARIARETSRG